MDKDVWEYEDAYYCRQFCSTIGFATLMVLWNCVKILDTKDQVLWMSCCGAYRPGRACSGSVFLAVFFSTKTSCSSQRDGLMSRWQGTFFLESIDNGRRFESIIYEIATLPINW